MPDNLKEDLAKLWELDQVPDSTNLPPKEEQIFNEFNTSYQRIEGRFMVKLPRVKDPPVLGNSRPQALKDDQIPLGRVQYRSS